MFNNMFGKKNSNGSISKALDDIDQEILDHKLNIIELNGRIRTLEEKKALLSSLKDKEVIVVEEQLPQATITTA